MRLSRQQTKAFALSCTIAISFAASSLAHAWAPGQPLVSCTDDCDFGDLLTLIANLTQFLLYIAAFVATLLFAYAGFKYIFAAGNEGEIKKVHNLFWSTFWGLVFMASAWLIIKVIVETLGSGAGGQFLGS